MTIPVVAYSLRDLLDSLPLDYRWVHVPGALDASAIQITNLSHHHLEAEPGGLHFCVRGSAYDGHRYAEKAVKRQAHWLWYAPTALKTSQSRRSSSTTSVKQWRI